MPVHLQDVPNNNVITPFGLFKLLWTPFGLKTFLRLMDSDGAAGFTICVRVFG